MIRMRVPKPNPTALVWILFALSLCVVAYVFSSLRVSFDRQLDMLRGMVP